MVLIPVGKLRQKRSGRLTASNSNGRDGHFILLWAACYEVENGQALVTRRVVERQRGVSWIKVTYDPGGGFSAVMSVLKAFYAFFLAIVCRPDTVYVVCSRSTMGFLRDAPILLLTLLGFRVLVHVHGSDLPDLLRRFGVGAFARALYRRCEILVPSVHLIPSLDKLDCKRVTLCENFAAEARGPIRPGRFEENTIRLLWNSNLMASKGLIECVNGARIAKARGAKVNMTLLGKPIGDKEASALEMASFTESLFAESWINVLGPVSAERASKIVQEHDAVLLPSRNECQPLAIIEAMAAGLEVVIRDTPALRTTVGSYPALVVKGDAESIAAAIEQLAAGAPRRAQVMLDAASAARQRFSPDRFDRDICSILTVEA
jgi:glycosyltransferase involved in cell wall biosynthesis